VGSGSVFINVLSVSVVITSLFTKRKGLALGILTASSGILGAFIHPITGNLIANLGWRGGYIAVGLTVIIITVPVTIFLLRKNPAEKNLLPYGEEEVAEVTETDAE